MITFLPHTLALILAGVPSLVAADEDSETNVTKSQKVEVTVRQSTTEDAGDAEPKTKFSGRIVIQGPDGKRQEYKIGDKLPEGWKLDLNSLSEPDKLLQIDGQNDAEENTTPRLMIGVVCAPASEALRSHLRLGEYGLLVTQVSDGLPAAKAGIQRNDILLSAGETKLQNLKDLVDVVSGSDGKELEIRALHAGEEVTVKVTPEQLSNKQAVEALDRSAADSERWETRVFRSPPGGRNWLMVPGIRLENGEDVDIRKMISEARAQALGNLQEATESDPAAAEQLRQLKKQVAELEKRLQALEEK